MQSASLAYVVTASVMACTKARAQPEQNDLKSIMLALNQSCRDHRYNDSPVVDR
jgi:hypothetical protein